VKSNLILREKINEPNSNMTNHTSDKGSMCICVCFLSCVYIFWIIFQIHKFGKSFQQNGCYFINQWILASLNQFNGA